MKKLIAELIGSFFICFVACLCYNSNLGQVSGIVIGLALMGMIYAGGHVSGAHYNPAVTLAALIRGKISVAEVPGYILVQLVGALLAGLMVSTFFLGVAKSVDVGMKVPQMMMGEMLGSFAIVYVLFNVVGSKDTAGNSFYGMAVGLTQAAIIIAMGSIAVVALNPAIALSCVASGVIGFKDLWLYLVGELLGAVLAALYFVYIHGKS
ncbi:MAG: aquaporin [Saprospiraceae bacterium]|nr:aquaporin [Saprospiraceae bacterium]